MPTPPARPTTSKREKRVTKSLTPRPQLTEVDHILMYRLSLEGKTQEEIAQRFSRDQTTVSAILQRYSDTVDLAKARARNRALEVTEATINGAIKVAKRGRGLEQVLELLDRLGVAEKRQSEGSGRAQVNIVIGMPTHLAGPDPFQALSPSTFAPDPLSLLPVSD